MRHSSAASYRRSSNTSDTVAGDTIPVSPRPAHGTSARSGKRVRFIDESFAQELITREKARLELKIQQLRNLHILTTTADPPESILKTSKNEDAEKKSEKRQKKKVKVTIAEDSPKKDKDNIKDTKEEKDNIKNAKKDNDIINDKQEKNKGIIKDKQDRNKRKSIKKNKAQENKNDEQDTNTTDNTTYNNLKEDITTKHEKIENKITTPSQAEQLEVLTAEEEADTNYTQEVDNTQIQSSESTKSVINETGKLRGINYQRLNELATPKGKTKPVLNSRRRKFMATSSPDHLKLIIPDKTPRTIPQLKKLSTDEIDYMVQPKTIREFQVLTLMRLPPQEKFMNYVNGSNTYHKKTSEISGKKRQVGKQCKSAKSTLSSKKQTLNHVNRAEVPNRSVISARQRTKNTDKSLDAKSASSVRHNIKKTDKQPDESNDAPKVVQNHPSNLRQWESCLWYPQIKHQLRNL